jgi:hypothetical protein
VSTWHQRTRTARTQTVTQLIAGTAVVAALATTLTELCDADRSSGDAGAGGDVDLTRGERSVSDAYAPASACVS